MVGEGALSGIARHVFDLAFGSLHSQSRFPPRVVAPPGALLDILERADIPTEPLPLTEGMYRTIGRLRTLYRHRAHEQGGNVIIHVHGPHAGWLGRLAAFGLNLPVVYTEYQWTADTRPYRPLTAFFDLLGMNLLDTVTAATIATSQAVAAFLLERGITREEKLFVIYNGVQSKVLPKRAAKTKNLLIGSVGTLRQGRGFEDFLHAVAIVRRKEPTLRAELVGEGPGVAALLRLRERLKLQAHVELFHFVRDLSPILAKWDIYIHPHRHDSFGQALVEAMRAGLPVVATKMGGTPEMVGNTVTGLLVSPHNPAALAEAIERLVEKPDLRQTYGKEGYNRVRALFTLEHMVNATLGVYATVARR